MDGIFWRLILWRARGGAPGVWTVRWDERALAFAPATAAEREGSSARRHPRSRAS